MDPRTPDSPDHAPEPGSPAVAPDAPAGRDLTSDPGYPSAPASTADPVDSTDPAGSTQADTGSDAAAASAAPAMVWLAPADGDTSGPRGRRRRFRPAGGGEPLSTEQVVTGTLSIAGVAVAMLFVWLQLQPGLLLRDTLTAGGDMGAHVWGPDFLRREVLPNFRLSGWTKDWYAGFPAYKFYMVVPALLVVLVDLVPFVSYSIAFKLVSVSGLVLMPLAAAFMGRMFRLPFPGPALLAFGTLPFMFDFDERFRIIGGNAASTLAGEFSFSISLTVCLVYLGVVARGLETGRYRAWGAALFALVMLNHLIPALFAVVATVLLGLWRLAMDTRKPASGATIALFVGSVIAGAWGGFSGALSVPVAVALPVGGIVAVCVVAVWHEPSWRATLLWVAPVGIIGALLSGFWSVPFVRNHAYFNDMGWERLQNYAENLGPAKSLTTVWYAVFVLALVGVVLSIVERQLIGGFLASSALVMGVLFAAWPDSQMWNARFLPFYYLSLYLLAAVGLALFVNILPGVPARAGAAVVAGCGLAFAAGLPLGVVPGSTLRDGQWNFAGFVDAPRSIVADWARWNYSGYQAKPKWDEYKAAVDAMAEIGSERGCGRAMWEYQTETLNAYGTPMALMLLPYWTKGCIGSMEGLYFESSATTPFHFLNQSELSQAPSRAQRDLPYSSLDVERGVKHLQLLGVRYYMALSPAAKSAADENADLSYLRDSGPWSIYEVADSELVEPLDYEPAVVEGLAPRQDAWLEPATTYYNDPQRWSVPLAGDGPVSWERIELGMPPEKRPVTRVTVTGIEETQDRIRFTVDEVGAPVLVKTSYFPNWKAKGADGPYRVMPNLMVVIPTSNRVELSYGNTLNDWAGLLLSLIGVAGVVLLARMAPPQLHRPVRRRRVVLTAADLDLSRYLLPLDDEFVTAGPAGPVPASAPPAGEGDGAWPFDDPGWPDVEPASNRVPAPPGTAVPPVVAASPEVPGPTGPPVSPWAPPAGAAGGVEPEAAPEPDPGPKP